MNLIFLDIDGVLNCELHYKSKNFTDYKDAKKSLRKSVKAQEIERLAYYESQLCKERIALLNQLCIDTGAVVVISSTWRMGKSVEQLQEILNNSGATFKIISKTGQCDCRIRGCEIDLWLKENIKPETHGCHAHDFYKYAIIDDDSDMLLNQQQHFFQTDPYSGLTHNTCYMVKRFFTHKAF